MSAAKSKSAAAISPVSAPPIQPPLCVPVSEAARLLSVSAWEIRRLCRRGVLGYKKLGRTKWLITSRSINLFASETTR
jgi:excisionase family DNA binding protein